MYNSMTFCFSFITADMKQSQAPTCIQITGKIFPILSNPAPARLPGRFGLCLELSPVPLHSAQFEGTATRSSVQNHYSLLVIQTMNILPCNTKGKVLRYS